MQARLSTKEFVALAKGLTVHGHSFTPSRMKDGFCKDGVALTPSLALIRGEMISTSFRSTWSIQSLL
ncbi:hypothetical protein BAE44_0021618 [Dichanthelium oligosanthes]|uniref:Uncharacterized protein n=1 Tax=Dichanthelium oligosanthes TaxID=888268 RepID=A0A1E5UWV9_9POAL|nr:hypothetical protein BAE44_0021618 [Dichanthelium oligosanthes]